MPEQERRSRLHLDQIKEAYPSAYDWLSEHSTAQLLGRERLPSAEEKIQLLGGEKHILEVVNSKTDPLSALFLIACRGTAMVPYEVKRFARLIEYTRSLHAGDVFLTVDKLLRQGDNDDGKFLKRIDGVTYIIGQHKSFLSVRQTTGYETTSEGTRLLALDLERKPSSGILGIFRPKPQTNS